MQQPNLGGALPNDEWVTDGESPDPTLELDLPSYHVMIRPVVIRTETKGGILLPDKMKDDIQYLSTVGRVLKLGDLAYNDKDKFSKGPWCKVGDYVCYGKHTGTKFLYKGVRLVIMYDDQIIMRIDDPKNLDPMYIFSG
jgi:co-chaperonin GroES (HSP10)